MAVARRTVGGQIGGAFCRGTSIPDKNIGFCESRDSDVSGRSRENHSAKPQFGAWVDAMNGIRDQPHCASGRTPGTPRASGGRRFGPAVLNERHLWARLVHLSQAAQVLDVNFTWPRNGFTGARNGSP